MPRIFNRIYFCHYLSTDACITLCMKWFRGQGDNKAHADNLYLVLVYVCRSCAWALTCASSRRVESVNTGSSIVLVNFKGGLRY